MTDEPGGMGTLGTWAKRYYYANRAAVELVLRPHGLGATQWTVLYSLSLRGPQSQRDIGRRLHLERATLSGVVATLVRKDLIRQTPDAVDQRQRLLELTDAGVALWDRLPDPFEQVRVVALDGISDADIETAIRVLEAATAHVEQGPFAAE